MSFVASAGARSVAGGAKRRRGGRHEQERRKFLRIQVLREVTLSSRQAFGLEPWGRMKVDYKGLVTTLPWIQKNADFLGMPAEDLREVAANLPRLPAASKRDCTTRNGRFSANTGWDGDLEVQQGYLPQIGNPLGLSSAWAL